MKATIAAIILTLSLAAQAQSTCTNCVSRSPAVVGTPVASRNVASINDVLNADLGEKLCGHISNRNAAAANEILQALDVESGQFSQIFNMTSCEGNRNLLRLAVDKSAMYNDLNYVKLIAGQMYKESRATLKAYLNAKSELDNQKDLSAEEAALRADISIMSYLLNEIERNDNSVKSWTSVHHFLAPFSV